MRFTDVLAPNAYDPYCCFSSRQRKKIGVGDEATLKKFGIMLLHDSETPFLKRELLFLKKVLLFSC